MCVWGSDFFLPSPLDTVDFHETVGVITCFTLTQMWCQDVIKLRSQAAPLLLLNYVESTPRCLWSLSPICLDGCTTVQSCLFEDSTWRLIKKSSDRVKLEFGISFSSPPAVISTLGWWAPCDNFPSNKITLSADVVGCLDVWEGKGVNWGLQVYHRCYTKLQQW